VGNFSTVGLLGARGLVGECVSSLLVQARHEIYAFSRNIAHRKTQNGVTWLPLGGSVKTTQTPTPTPTPTPNSNPNQSTITNWLCVAPIWVLPDYFAMLESYGVRRIVALSSTSCFTKNDSNDLEEQATAQRLVDAENRLHAWAESRGVEWVILRPTLIYGYGRDKNITEIIKVIRRFGFFPLLGQAQGLRQPIHADDVAGACVAALNANAVANQAYNISGSETLSYRDMVERIFKALKKPVRLFAVPLFVFRFAVAVLRLLPRYRKWTPAMAERMNRDLVFDHSDATRDFGFKPRGFVLTEKDISV
jgi:uncharacterized protein YbjT (DUF2867 family)